MIIEVAPTIVESKDTRRSFPLIVRVAVAIGCQIGERNNLEIISQVLYMQVQGVGFDNHSRLNGAAHVFRRDDAVVH